MPTATRNNVLRWPTVLFAVLLATEGAAAVIRQVRAQLTQGSAMAPLRGCSLGWLTALRRGVEPICGRVKVSRESASPPRTCTAGRGGILVGRPSKVAQALGSERRPFPRPCAAAAAAAARAGRDWAG